MRKIDRKDQKPYTIHAHSQRHTDTLTNATHRTYNNTTKPKQKQKKKQKRRKQIKTKTTEEWMTTTKNAAESGARMKQIKYERVWRERDSEHQISGVT